MLITNDLDVSCLLSKCACIIIVLFLAMLCAVICSTALKVNAVFFQIWVIFIKELSYLRKQNQKLMNSSWKNIEYSHYLVKSNQLLSIYFVCVATGFINHLAPYPVLFLCGAETVLNFMPYNDWKLLWVLR